MDGIKSVFIIPTKHLYKLGENGVTVLTERDRNGEMSKVPTITVYVNGAIALEIDKSNCIVYYQ